MTTRIAIYKRVSTDRQDTAMQQHAIDAWLARYPRPYTATIYEDDGYSGAKTKRPAYNRLCDDVKAGRVDAVVVYRLDRLSRDAVTALRLLMDWIQADVEFYSVSQQVLSLGRENPLRLSLLAIFAELAQIERDTIASRVRAGMAAAKARGARFGARPKVTATQRGEMQALRASGQSFRAIARRFRVTHNTVIKVLAKESGNVELHT